MLISRPSAIVGVAISVLVPIPDAMAVTMTIAIAVSIPETVSEAITPIEPVSITSVAVSSISESRVGLRPRRSPHHAASEVKVSVSVIVTVLVVVVVIWIIEEGAGRRQTRDR